MNVLMLLIGLVCGLILGAGVTVIWYDESIEEFFKDKDIEKLVKDNE